MCDDKTTGCCGGLEDILSPDLFKALGDPRRKAIFVGLAKGGEQTVGEVSQCCPIDLSVVSRHLKLLASAGIVSAEKRGKQVYYKVRTRSVVALLRQLADAIEQCCPDEATCECVSPEQPNVEEET